MNDIDFDELDRAVNSLAASNKKAAQTTNTPEPTPAAKPTATPAPQAESKAVPVTVRSLSRSRLATKPAGTGRAIDIMTPKPIKKPSRVGQTIQPPKNASTPAPIVEPKEQKEPEATKPPVSKTPSTEPKKPQPKQKEEMWPDPLDFHNQESKEPEAPADKPAPEPEPKTAPAAQSPFIEGAKVEKRPLGGYSPPAVEPKAPEPATPETKPAALPDELQPEVVAVESGENAATTPADEAEATKSEPLKEETHVNQQLHDTAMMSIPKQYKTADQPTDDKPRPVFDTTEYHPPLLEETAHAAHQTSIWAKLFMALLVVAVVAVGGYLAFIYFIQHF